MEIIDILIYLLASFGLLFTMVTIIEKNNCNIYNRYCFIDRTVKEEEIVIKLTQFNNENKSKVIARLKNGEFSDIYTLSGKVEIKYN